MAGRQKMNRWKPRLGVMVLGALACGVALAQPHHPKTVERCERLEQRIERLDAQARQALSGPRQDRLRTERMKARDEQYRLRCPPRPVRR